MTTRVPQDERVSVQLKPMVDLAKKAGLLSHCHQRIQSSQSGAYVSSFKGRGMAFEEVRVYQPGDDIRGIDWRVTARTNKTHSKVFREERERPIFISVDLRPTMNFATRGSFKSVQASKLAALFAWSAQLNGDRVGGQVFNEQGCQELKPASGRGAVLHFLNALVKPPIKKHQPLSLQQVLKRLAQHARPGSLLYIISDFRGLNNPVERQLSLLAKHCELQLVHVYDPLECELPKKGQYRFTNGERETVVDTAERQRVLAYQQLFQQRQEELRAMCHKWRMTLVECRTTDDPFEVLR
ncbi:MAG: DUF58 domain-containing protein [Cycloclasticus sp.]